MSDDVQAIYAGIAQTLGARLPQGWARAALEVSLHDGRLAVEAYASDDRRREIALGANVTRGLAADLTRLRELTSAENGESWHHATFTLFDDGRYDCAFFYPQRAEAAAV